MEIQRFNLFVPLEIGDVVKIKEEGQNEYKVIDIQHIYSAKERQAIGFIIKVQNIKTREESFYDYNRFNWQIIKENRGVK